MRGYIKWMDENPKLLKIILCIWFLDVTWAVYRIGRAAVRKNWFHMVLGIIWVVMAASFGWILDLIWVILFDRIFWFIKD